jgi:protein gp37
VSKGRSSIEWTDATWNPVVGCTPVSPGCLNCYAATHAARGLHEVYVGLTVRRKVARAEGGGTRAVFNGTVRCLEDRLAQPLHWRRPRRVFVNSMSDLFHEDVPFEFVDRVFAVMALTPRHTYQILTKRPERMAEYLNGLADLERLRTWMNRASDGGEHRAGAYNLTTRARRSNGARAGRVEFVPPFRNVWLGTSVEDQDAADKRIAHLLRCPASVRFLSVEPLLGPVDVTRVRTGRAETANALTGGLEVADTIDGGAVVGRGRRVDWVIVGGESGTHARPCDVTWIRSIVAQCRAAGVPVFVKQLGKWTDGPHEDVPCVQRWLLSDGKRRGTWYPPVIRSDYDPDRFDKRPANAVAWGLADPKGGKMAEWPPDLRVRELPAGVPGAAAPASAEHADV